MTRADPDAPSLAPSAPTTILVCTTCRVPGDADARPGQRLLEALTDRPLPDDVVVTPVECLSVCKRPCTVAFVAPGKWTYVYADLPAEGAASLLLTGAALYGAAPDGLIAWRDRPDALKKGVVARIPPMPIHAQEPVR